MERSLEKLLVMMKSLALPGWLQIIMDCNGKPVWSRTAWHILLHRLW